MIYLSRSLEQTNFHSYRALLNGEQVHRVYLDELGAIAELPLGVAAIALNMLRKNLPIETIAEVTGLTIAQLQALQSQNTR